MEELYFFFYWVLFKMKIECHWEGVRGESYQTTIRQLSLSPSMVSAGWGGCELPCGRDSVVSPENHADSWRFRVPGLHHSVWRHWHTGPIHLTWGITQASTHTPCCTECYLKPFSNVSNVCLFVQDHDFFQHLEMHMRSEFPPLCGRDHLSFRSYYFPVKVAICWSCFYTSFHLFQTCISGSLPVRDLEICPESFFLSSVFLSRMW